MGLATNYDTSAVLLFKFRVSFRCSFTAPLAPSIHRANASYSRGKSWRRSRSGNECAQSSIEYADIDRAACWPQDTVSAHGLLQMLPEGDGLPKATGNGCDQTSWQVRFSRREASHHKVLGNAGCVSAQHETRNGNARTISSSSKRQLLFPVPQ